MRRQAAPDVRLMALTTLLEVTSGKKRPKEAIEERSAPLDRRDRAFLMELLYGVLRYTITLDWILSRFLKRPEGLDRFTLTNLRLAAYQIVFLRTPDWAVVSEAMRLEKEKHRKGGRPSVVNAVLRSLLRRRDEFLLPLSLPDPVSSISVNASLPAWLVRRWVERFGPDRARDLAAAYNGIPPLTLRVNTLRSSREEVLQMLDENSIGAEPAAIAPEGIRLTGTHVYSDLSFLQGLVIAQDEASQLVSHLLGPVQGERVLDACAAPGGKTTHIAQLMGDHGEIIAVEKDPERITLLKENVGELGIRSVRVMNADVLDLPDSEVFDRILLDAPCSSLGVMRRNPDVKYRHRARDLTGFGERQFGLLRSVSRLLRPGGVLVYSVCTTEPEECDNVIRRFLQASGEFRIIDAVPGPLGSLVTEGFLKTDPLSQGMDGFFGVGLCRER